MTDFNTMTDGIREVLNETNRLREAALTLSREIVRLSANSIRSTHRAEFDAAENLKSQARSKVEETKELLKDHPEVFFAGYVHDGFKEYAESELTYALVRGLPVPEVADLGVMVPSYLNGMAEACGELRRHVLDLLRDNKLDRAEEILGTMDDAYYMLISFDYPDAVTQGLRRQTDMVRGVLERCRAEITISRRQQSLEDSIGLALERFGNEDRR